MNAHLTKPIEPTALYRAIAYWSQTAGSEHKLQIAGINVTQGLRHCADNASLYESLLRRFVASSANTAQELRQAIESQDFASAERAAHTLKGVGANLGATHCSRLSGELEQALHQCAPAPVLAPLLVALEQHLAALLAAIAQALPVSEPAALPVPGELDRSLLQSVCWQLAELLEASKFEASQLATAHAALLQQGFGAGSDVLQASIRDFDYPQALVQLRQSASALQIAVPAGL
jgi:two-component system sensor histidine kinase/response regulator